MPSALKPTPADLGELLRGPEVGVEVGASMRAVKAICVHLAGQARTSPHLLGALDLIEHTSDLTIVLAIAAGVGGDPESVTGNQIGRAIGVASMVLSGLATMGQRKVTLDEGAPRLAVKSIIDQLAVVYLDATVEEREALVLRAATLINAKVGAWPTVAVVRKALAMGTQRGRSRRAEAANRRVAVPKTSKNAALFELLRDLGIAPATVAAMKRTLARRKKG